MLKAEHIMKLENSVCASLCVLIFSTPALSIGQTISPYNIKSLIDMSLEELMQVEVVTTSRRPTRLQHVAENISIITAEDIRSMNAHSVNEILDIITGYRNGYRGAHIGGNASFHIHASNYEHVLLLLDNVRLNDVDAGYPDAVGVPVQIIERIEVVKGPASSAWGSALGGVINIVTKPAGNTKHPTGSLYGSYGKGPSFDYRAEIAGKAGNTGYYLYGGYMDSDGLLGDRYFNTSSFYGKVTSELTEDTSLTFTAGYWYPDGKDFDWPAYDLNYTFNTESFLVTGKLAAGLSHALQFNLEMHYYGTDWLNHHTTLITNELLIDENWVNDTWGGNANITWEKQRHTILLGVEFNLGDNNRTWRFPSDPPFNWGTESREDWAVYFNDTIKWEKLTLIPGIRYDHLSIVDASSHNIISPSLGATYTITDDTLLRATMARGFIRPGIGLTVGAFGYEGYPDLKPEDIWSLQAGLETDYFSKIYLKADVFYHHQNDTWHWNDEGIYVNGGTSKRTGFELNAVTSPFENFTAALGFTYVWVEPFNVMSDESYSLNLKLNYSTERLGTLILFGRYCWLSEYEKGLNAESGNMIWSIHYNKDIFMHEPSDTTVNFFISARNIFNGTHYNHEVFKNPGRWVEAGLRFEF